MRETIELEEGDSIAAVHRKLELAQSKRVALIVPRGNPLLRKEVNLALLRRFAESLALDLVLVTHERAIIDLARIVGLRTVGSVPAAYRVRSQRAYTAPPVPVATRLSTPSVLPPRREDAPAPKLRLEAVSGGRLVVAGLTLLGVVLVLLVVAGLAFPSASVSLDPVGEKASLDADIVAGTDVQQIDYTQKRIPARTVQTEVIAEDSVQTTGKQTVADQHSSGEVVFANKTGEEVVVPKGTRVRTSDGVPVAFYTLFDAKVPGSYGATVRVPVSAFEPGPAGDVQALTIRTVEGEIGFKVEVLNDRPTQGGSERRVSVASTQDRDRLRASLMQKLQQAAYDKLVASMGQADWVPPDSLELQIANETFDKKVDEQSDTLRLRMTVRVTGISVQGQATRALMTRLLETKSGKGLVVNAGTLQVQQPVGSATMEGKSVRFKASANAMLVAAIDLKSVSKRLAGQDTKAALAWLGKQYTLRQAPRITVRPGWWPRLPWLPGKIEVQLAGGL